MFIALFVACGGDPPVTEIVEVPAAPAVIPDPPKFAAWNTTMRPRFDGTWAIRGGLDQPGTVNLWTFSPTSVAVDGLTARLDLRVVAPCQLQLQETSGAKAESRSLNFAWDGDVLYAGVADLGMRKGDDIVVCGADDLTVMRGGTCAFWKMPPAFFTTGKWTHKPATCAVTKDGDVERFHAESPDIVNGAHPHSLDLVFHGDALIPAVGGGVDPRVVTTKYADLAAAKAALAPVVATP
jgi:hypothetical protein